MTQNSSCLKSNTILKRSFFSFQENVLNYGFENLTYKEWKSVRKLNADEYICYISTHCENITLEEPYKSNFYAGIRKAIVEAGNEIAITDTIPLYLVQKPL